MKILIFNIFLILLVFSCKSPEAREPVSRNSGSFIKEAVERNKKLVAKEEAKIQEMIKEDSANQYISSPNGFWYYYEKQDTTATETPEFGDLVEFDYDIRTLDGETIYSDAEIPTRTYAMDKEELFSGLREGLKLMHEGETITFLFPSHKAYGFYGDKDRIGRNVPIISTVTLHTINKEE